MKKIFLFIFFLLVLVGTVFSLNVVDLRESFDTLGDYGTYYTTALDQQDIENISSEYVIGDIGRWYIGSLENQQNDNITFKDIGGDTVITNGRLLDIVLVHYLEDPIYFTENSRIEFTFNNSMVSPSEKYVLCAGWVYLNDSCNMICSDSTNNAFRQLYCGQPSGSFLIMENNTVINTTTPTKFVLDPFYFYENKTGINELVIEIHSSQSVNSLGTLWDINFTGFVNGSNVLPHFNVSVNTSYICVNKNDSFPVSIPLIWDVYDEEGDTIWYGEGQSNINETYFKDFTRSSLLFGRMVFDPKPLEDLESNCEFYAAETTSELYHKPVNTLDAVGDETYALDINGDCDNETRDINLIFERVGSAINFETEFLDFDSGESINISTFDDSLEKSTYDFILELSRTGNLYEVDSLLSNGTRKYLFNFTSPKDYFRLQFYNTVNRTTGYGFKVVYSSTGTSLDTTEYYSLNLDAADSVYKGVNFDIEQGDDIYVNYFYYTLKFYSADSWSTVQPSTITFNRPSWKEVVLFVSDDDHVTGNDFPTEYDYETIFVMVEQKEYCIDSDSLVDIRDTVDDLIGNPFKNWFMRTDTYDKALKFVNFLFFALFIFFTVILYLSSKQVKILVPVLLSSLICLVFSILLYTKQNLGNIIGFVILISLSYAGLIYKSKG